MNKNLAPQKTWKGEYNYSLLNIGQELEDTHRREQKSLQLKHRSQKINLRNISVKIVKKQTSYWYRLQYSVEQWSTEKEKCKGLHDLVHIRVRSTGLEMHEAHNSCNRKLITFISL